jgi:hypothetical protein
MNAVDCAAFCGTINSVDLFWLSWLGALGPEEPTDGSCCKWENSGIGPRLM